MSFYNSNLPFIVCSLKRGVCKWKKFLWKLDETNRIWTSKNGHGSIMWDWGQGYLGSVFSFSFIFSLFKQTIQWSGGYGMRPWARSRGFESQQWILDGHFSHIFVVKIILFVWKDWNKRKRGRGWSIFKNKLFNKLMWNMSIQYPVKPMTSCSWVASHNHQTKALTAYLPR